MKLPEMTEAQLQGYWAQIDKTVGQGPLGSCWMWTGRTASAMGYGAYSFNGSTFYAHRLAYKLAYGGDPDKLCVLHKCDVPRCVNPAHLFLGTRADNAIDRTQKRRTPAGEKHWTRHQPEKWADVRQQFSERAKERNKTFNGENHPTTKLTAEIVREIKTLANEGMGNKELAEKFNVTHSNISAIVLGKSWKHVEVPTREKDRTYIDGKLTQEQRDEIRQLDASGVTKSDLARRYNVGWTTIGRICNG